jgi:hypothetical protein
MKGRNTKRNVHTTAEYVKERFPGRFELVLGDSTDTVPNYMKTFPNFRCNVIHVDGGHSDPVPLSDLNSFFPVSNTTWSYLLIDNANIDTLSQYSLGLDTSKAYLQMINDGLVVHEICYESPPSGQQVWWSFDGGVEWCGGRYNLLSSKEHRNSIEVEHLSLDTIVNKTSGLLVFSFFAIHTSYSGYASDPAEFFRPYIKNRICYIKKHNLSFALQIVDWTKQMHIFKSVFLRLIIIFH